MNTTELRASTRRTFLKDLSLATGLVCLGGSSLSAKESRLHLSSNSYSWNVYFSREKKNFDADLDAGFAALKASDIDGFEPGISSVQQLETMAPLLQKHQVELPSIYCSSALHEKAEAEKSSANILAIAKKAKTLGTRIVVTNPNPIRWGGPENKTDAQLRLQAGALNDLGREIAKLGVKLAYHNHDLELRNAAREFHHMMCGTAPEHVTLCLDAHWVYRGSGNSEVAMLDVLQLYGARISELHLRQSTSQVWSETFGEGDLDYGAVVRHLVRIHQSPLLVMEQACEAGTPNTLQAVEIFRRSADYARRLFAPLA